MFYPSLARPNLLDKKIRIKGGVSFLETSSNWGEVKKVKMASLWSCEERKLLLVSLPSS